MATIYVVVRGGCVQEVRADDVGLKDVQVELLDYDSFDRADTDQEGRNAHEYDRILASAMVSLL